MSDSKKVIVALDKPTVAEALELASLLDPNLCRVKVGKELFTSAGPAVIESLHKLEFEVFLDLKFHDIPNTVASAVKVAASQGVWMLTLHASGGERMLASAREAADTVSNSPILVAVTVLTSMDQAELNTIGITQSISKQVQLLAEIARSAGCDGVVCSAQEAELLTATLPDLLKVTPGIRLAGDDASDQRRVMTPLKAVECGADYLVIGRSVTGAASPDKVLQQIAAQLQTTRAV